MSVEMSYRIFPKMFRTVKVQRAVIRQHFSAILSDAIYSGRDHVMLNVESDEAELECLVRTRVGALSVNNIAAVYYIHFSSHENQYMLVCEFLVDSVVFFAYVSVIFAHNLFLGSVSISCYGYRFFYSMLPDDIRRKMLHVNFIESVPHAPPRYCLRDKIIRVCFPFLLR